MIAYVGQTRSAKLIRLLVEEGIGECTQRGEYPPARVPWVYDNGAFSDWKVGRAFDSATWRDELRRLRGHAVPPAFVVAPDLVAGGLGSLAMSRGYLPELTGIPAYLVLQDGMDEGIDVSGFAGLFVGGTLEWKLATGAAWVAFAHGLGLPCHIGRVGTPGRVRWAKEIGADSIDSCLPLWSTENLRRFLAALRGTGQETLWELGA